MNQNENTNKNLDKQIKDLNKKILEMEVNFLL